MKNDENIWHGTVGKNRVIQPRLEKEEQTLLFDALELRRSALNNATFAKNLRKQVDAPKHVSSRNCRRPATDPTAAISRPTASRIGGTS